VESQKAKAGGLLASHSGSRPLPFPTQEGPEPTQPFGGPGPGSVIPGPFPAWVRTHRRPRTAPCGPA
jgi:hypothetical protein